MRLLLIEEDKRRCDDFRQRLASWRPEAELVVRDPVAQGRLPLEFLAQAYDAVLLSDEWSGGGGLGWAKELAGRSGFAPLILLSGQDSAAYEAIPFGVQVVVRDDPAPDRLIEVLTAAEQRQSFARAVWRTSVAGRDSQRFGGAFIRGYRHIRRIATGTVSDLYLGESEAAGELVALKVARDRHAEQGDLDDSFRRFLQEYEIVQRIRSPGVVRLYDLGVSDEHAWLVMEYFAAGDLRGRMRAGLSVRRALYNSISIARALQAIHASGVLHRDLKPGNVMLRDDGSIALIDFGLSKDAALARDDTDRGMIFGTPHYMSPEQGHGEPIDARSDLYSLGVILFEMLAREKPYKAENPMALIYKHRKEPVPRLPLAFAAMQPIIDRLLAKAPEDRYADAGEAATALEGAFRLVLKRGGGLSAEREDGQRDAAGRYASQRDAAHRYDAGSILLAATPAAWVDAAVEGWQELLVDHANCEKKAASTAVALIFAYPEDTELGLALSRLAREELRHFEQVQSAMIELGVAFIRQKPGRYAAGLRRELRTSEPGRKLDLLLSGALIEARSCERFKLLADRLPAPLGRFYGRLAESEARHFELYVGLASRRGPDEWQARLGVLARTEAELATAPDGELRFHSGPPG